MNCYPPLYQMIIILEAKLNKYTILPTNHLFNQLINYGTVIFHLLLYL